MIPHRMLLSSEQNGESFWNHSRYRLQCDSKSANAKITEEVTVVTKVILIRNNYCLNFAVAFLIDGYWITRSKFIDLLSLMSLLIDLLDIECNDSPEYVAISSSITLGRLILSQNYQFQYSSTHA